MIFLRIWISGLSLVAASALTAQNTLDGMANRIPEEEAKRQSSFIAAETQRLLGRYDKAIALHEQFLRENPNNADAWHALARTHHQNKDLASAIAAMRKATAIADKSVWYWRYLIELYEEAGQFRDVVAALEKLIKLEPDNPEHLRRLAVAQLMIENPKAALKSLEKAEKMAGISEEGALTKFMIYHKLDDRKRAITELQRLADAFPNRPEHRRRLADYQRAIGDRNAAIATYKALLQRNPADVEAQRALAELEGTEGAGPGERYAFAESLSNPEVSLDVKIARIAPLLAPDALRSDPVLQTLLPQWAAAIEKAHPDDPKALSLSGDIYYVLDRNNEALDRYQRCIKANPRVFSVWDNALQILAAQQNYAEMERVADQAIDAFPNQAKAYYYYAAALSQRGAFAQALDQLRQAQLMADALPDLWFDISALRAAILLRQNDPQAAIEILDEALRRPGGNQRADLLETYGDVLSLKGQKRDAVEYWKKASKIQPSPQLERKLN